MSRPLLTRALLRCYPRAWRDRYGDELEALIEQSGAERSWRASLDLARGGARESIRELGLSPRDETAAERSRAGAVLVLSAWSLFVLAGCCVQKLSEHWQDATSSGDRALPRLAFDALTTAAVTGGAVVLLGVALVLPALVRFVQAGGRPVRRGPAIAVTALTAATIPATGAIVAWAHRLTDAQRTGADHLYAVGVACWLLLAATCLLAWTALAVKVSRELAWPAATLRVEGWLAALVTVAMLAMTVATAVWWGALARSAPSFLGGGHGTPVPPLLLAAMLLMVLATSAGVAGTVRAHRSPRRGTRRTGR